MSLCDSRHCARRMVCVEYLSFHKEAALVVDSGATRLGTLPIQRAERLRKHLHGGRADMCV